LPAVPPGAAGVLGELATDLAGLLSALRGLAIPDEALLDPSLTSYRGGSLSALDGSTRRNLAECRGLSGLELDLDACLRIWNAAMELPPGPAPVAGWLHGDLLAENLLLRDGRLHAVLDFGGLAVGDPTVDLVVGWEVLDAAGRATLRSLLQVDEATWLRGRAWALAIALMTFSYYWHTMPGRCASRRAIALAVLDDPPPS
jgi:aminoglycoside phosphotransferase (APT) family kinase protein